MDARTLSYYHKEPILVRMLENPAKRYSFAHMVSVHPNPGASKRDRCAFTLTTVDPKTTKLKETVLACPSKELCDEWIGTLTACCQPDPTLVVQRGTPGRPAQQIVSSPERERPTTTAASPVGETAEKSQRRGPHHRRMSSGGSRDSSSSPPRDRRLLRQRHRVTKTNDGFLVQLEEEQLEALRNFPARVEVLRQLDQTWSLEIDTSTESSYNAPLSEVAAVLPLAVDTDSAVLSNLVMSREEFDMLARGMVAKRSRWHTILLDSVLITEEHDQLPATELLRHFVLPVIQLPYEPGVELVLAPALLNEEDQLRWRRFHRRSSSLVGAEGGEVGVPLSPSALAKPLPPDSEVSEEGDDDGPLPKYITTTKLICPSDWELFTGQRGRQCPPQQLGLTQCQIDDACCALLGQCFEGGMVPALQLNGNQVTAVGVRAICSGLLVGRRADLQFFHKPKNVQRALCRTIHLYLNENEMQDDVLEVALSFCVPPTEVESPEGGLLEELYLGSNRLTAASIPPCIPYLHNVDCCLLSLMLKDNDINDEGATALAVALAANQSLQRLWLSKNPITGAGYAKILDSISSNSGSKITCVYFGDHPCLSEHPEHQGLFAASLATFIKARKPINLGLDGCQLGDEGVHLLLEAHKHCLEVEEESRKEDDIVSLSTLMLSCNQLSDDIIPDLATVMSTDKTILQLDLTGNHFTEEGLCALVDEGLGAQHYTRLAQGLDTEEGLYNATLQVLIMNLPGEQVFSPEFTEKLCDLQEYHPTLHDIWGSAPTQDTDGTRR